MQIFVTCLKSADWQLLLTCVGTLQLFRHTEAQPVSSRYLHLHAASPTTLPEHGAQILHPFAAAPS